MVHWLAASPNERRLFFGERLQESGVMGRMSTVGCALYHAMAASFIASLQTKLLD